MDDLGAKSRHLKFQIGSVFNVHHSSETSLGRDTRPQEGRKAKAWSVKCISCKVHFLSTSTLWTGLQGQEIELYINLVVWTYNYFSEANQDTEE